MKMRVDVIALSATAAICVQNWMAVLAFGWASIHGAGAEALLAFLPAAIGIGLVWAGAVFAGGGDASRRKTVTYAAYALGILLVNEAVLPGTPLQAWRRRRAFETIEVRNLRDEVLLSARGNPIGIRVTFEIVFPRTVVGRVIPSTLGAIDVQLPFAVHPSRGHRSDIAPTPSEKDGYDVYLGGTSYELTTDSLPMFLIYDESTQKPCLTKTITGFSEADLHAALSRGRNVRFRGAVMVTGPYTNDRVIAKEFVTSRAYNLEAMYQTIVAEGQGPCETSTRSGSGRD